MVKMNEDPNRPKQTTMLLCTERNFANNIESSTSTYEIVPRVRILVGKRLTDRKKINRNLKDHTLIHSFAVVELEKKILVTILRLNTIRSNIDREKIISRCRNFQKVRLRVHFIHDVK